MADGNPTSRVLAIALLAISGFISYQAWTNAKLTTASMDLAKQHACDLDSSCIVLDDKPRIGKADVIQHRYEFKTTHGIMTVTCKRELYFLGDWKCSAEKGQLLSGGGI
jgi:hypothetical protein